MTKTIFSFTSLTFIFILQSCASRGYSISEQIPEHHELYNSILPSQIFTEGGKLDNVVYVRKKADTIRKIKSDYTWKKSQPVKTQHYFNRYLSQLSHFPRMKPLNPQAIKDVSSINRGISSTTNNLKEYSIKQILSAPLSIFKEYESGRHPSQLKSSMPKMISEDLLSLSYELTGNAALWKDIVELDKQLSKIQEETDSLIAK